MNESLSTVGPTPNPWRTIWLSPRITIRRLLEADVRPGWVPVVALTALASAFAATQVDPDSGTFSFARSMMPVILGIAQVIFGVVIGPFLLAFVGGWLGGEADPADIREAVAWSYVPVAVATVAWLPLLLAYGSRAFTADLSPATPAQWAALPALLVLFATNLWSLVLLVATLAEVQRFSIAKAIACLIILSIPVVLIGMLG